MEEAPQVKHGDPEARPPVADPSEALVAGARDGMVAVGVALAVASLDRLRDGRDLLAGGRVVPEFGEPLVLAALRLERDVGATGTRMSAANAEKATVESIGRPSRINSMTRPSSASSESIATCRQYQ
jgi:hypothetical protein